MKNLITCLVMCMLSGTALATTWTVDDDGKADFDNIQAAIDAASDGDEIVIAPGTYTGTGTNVVDLLGKGITLRASGPAEETLIDGEFARSGLHTGNNSNNGGATIQGLTVTKGSVGQGNGGQDGGGVCMQSNSHVNFIDCRFTGNVARYMGGAVGSGHGNVSASFVNCLFEGNSSTDSLSGYGGAIGGIEANIVDCTFRDNNAEGFGGAVAMNRGGSLTGCLFENNHGKDGGGMFIQVFESISIANCRFQNNSATYQGGGVACYAYSGTEFIDCIFESNTAPNGGGVCNSDTSANYLNCTFLDNSASFGGGILNRNGSDSEFTNCLVEGNSGNGIMVQSSFPTINACVIRNNSGNGIRIIDFYAIISDSIICGNAGEQVEGNWTDAGGNTISDLCDEDGDGVADETDNCDLYNPDQTDCNGNGVGDVCDIADLESYDINENGIPDECECLADIALDDGQVNVHDLLILIAMWGTDSSIADINYDGIVNVHDLLLLIGAWGPCE